FDRQRHHRLFDLDRRAVLQDRFAAADLLQCPLAAFVVQLLEAVEAVAAIAHHPAGLADIAELLGQFQEPDLRSDDLLILGHSLISVSPEGGSRSSPVRDRAPPPAPSRKPTTTVGLSSSYYSYGAQTSSYRSADASAMTPARDGTDHRTGARANVSRAAARAVAPLIDRRCLRNPAPSSGGSHK